VEGRSTITCETKEERKETKELISSKDRHIYKKIKLLPQSEILREHMQFVHINNLRDGSQSIMLLEDSSGRLSFYVKVLCSIYCKILESQYICIQNEYRRMICHNTQNPEEQ
jgi:hypothetical protein